jgi:hypothetical protein
MAQKIESIKLPANVWLQEVGAHLGKPAGELEAGDVTVWNWGATETITEIVRTTATMIVVRLDSGRERRFKKSRTVAIKGAGILTGVTKHEADNGFAWRTVDA